MPLYFTKQTRSKPQPTILLSTSPTNFTGTRAPSRAVRLIAISFLCRYRVVKYLGVRAITPRGFAIDPVEFRAGKFNLRDPPEMLHETHLWMTGFRRQRFFIECSTRYRRQPFPRYIDKMPEDIFVPVQSW